MKRIIQSDIGVFFNSDISSIDDLIAKLIEAKEKGANKLNLKIEKERGYSSPYIRLIEERKETDEEYETRILKNNEWREERIVSLKDELKNLEG